MFKLLPLVFISIFLVFFFALPVYAQNTPTFSIVQPKGAGVQVGTGANQSAEFNVGRIMKNAVALFFVAGGVGVVIYFLWGAVEWIFSGGDKERVASARRRMIHAIVGLTLLALSFVIINFVGKIVGFNPLGCLQVPGLQETNAPVVGQPC